MGGNRELEDRLKRQPSIEELSEYMKMPRKKLNIIKKAVKAYNSPTQSGSAVVSKKVECR